MCERIIKIIRERRREYIKELIDNPLLTNEEYEGLVLKIIALNEILIINKIEREQKQDDIIIA